MPVVKPQPRRARRVRNLSASDRVRGEPAKVGGQLSLLFTDSKVADLALLSPRAATLAAMNALQAELDTTSAVDDWRAHCLDPKPGAQFDQDEAFVSFFGFCNMVGLTGADRLTHGDFVRALCAAGFPLGIGRDGRKFHRGCRLVDKFGGVISTRGAAQVGLFIAERCKIGGAGIADRGRSSIIFAAYCSWARERNSEPIGIARFSKHLISKGFRRVRSDGHWWQGLRLAEQETSAGTLC